MQRKSPPWAIVFSGNDLESTNDDMHPDAADVKNREVTGTNIRSMTEAKNELLT